MKRSIFLLAMALVISAFALSLSGCAKDKTCDHIFNTEGNYSTDATYHWYACQNGCDATSEKQGHLFGDVVPVKAATCYEEGAGYVTCIECEYKKSVTIPTTSHTYGTAYESDATHHWRKCANCPAITAKTEHKFTAHGHDPENHWLTCSCGAKGHVEAHDWNQVDNGDGTITLTCKNTICNTTITTEDPNHNHVWVDGEITKAPSCTEVGEQSVRCGCGATSTKSIDKTSHSFSHGEYQKDDSYHWRNCVCGEQPSDDYKVEHSYDSDVTIEGAYKVKYCVCGQEVREPLREGGYIDPEGWT